MNRQITGRIATYHFSPTPLSRENLIKENVDKNNIIVTGNTVIDALHWVVGKINTAHDLRYEQCCMLKEKDMMYHVLKMGANWFL